MLECLLIFFFKCLLILIDDNLKVLAKNKYVKG